MTAPSLLLAAALGLLVPALALILAWRRSRRWIRRVGAQARVRNEPPAVPPQRLLASARPPAWLLRLASDPAARAQVEALVAARGRPSAGLQAVALAAGLALVAAPLVLAGTPMLLALPLAPPLLLLLLRRALAHAGARRQARLLRLLPDALALMVRALRAGVPLAEAVAEAARECPAPLGREFARVHEAVRLGQPLEAALWDLARRAGAAEFDFLCVTVALQRETGGNLAVTLAGLETMIRKRQALGLKVRALSSEARTSALIIGALPVLMALGLALLAPDYLAPMVATSAGQLLLLLAAGMLATGALAMAGLVRAQARA